MTDGREHGNLNLASTQSMEKTTNTKFLTNARRAHYSRISPSISSEQQSTQNHVDLCTHIVTRCDVEYHTITFRQHGEESDILDKGGKQMLSNCIVT